MSENKCCGNCKHFKNEDVEGWGWCTFNKTKTHCAQSWDCHNSTSNGWTEITSDNVDDVYKIDISRLVIAVVDSHGSSQYAKYDGMSTTLDAMATIGGCYSLVLPELRLDERL